MLLMVAVAVPMYICATGSIPIALSLMLKGLSPGVAFVLLMAGPAANFASVMVLRKTLGNRATAIYVASVIVTAIAFGLVIDTLLPASWFTPIGSISSEANCHLHLGWFDTTCSLILTALLLYAFLRNRRASHKFHECCAGDASSHSECLISTTNENKMKTMFYQVKGMSCNHCKASVEKTLATIEGIESVIVDLSTGQVAITGNAKPETIAQAVTNAGFEFAGPVDTANKAKES